MDFNDMAGGKKVFTYDPVTFPSGEKGYSGKCNIPIPDNPTCRVVLSGDFGVYNILEKDSKHGIPANLPPEMIEEWRDLSAKMDAMNQVIEEIVLGRCD